MPTLSDNVKPKPATPRRENLVRVTSRDSQEVAHLKRTIGAMREEMERLRADKKSTIQNALVGSQNTIEQLKQTIHTRSEERRVGKECRL